VLSDPLRAIVAQAGAAASIAVHTGCSYREGVVIVAELVRVANALGGPRLADRVLQGPADDDDSPAFWRAVHRAVRQPAPDGPSGVIDRLAALPCRAAHA